MTSLEHNRPPQNDVLLMGAVAYDPKVITIWDGFRRWLIAHDLPFDYLLYSNYERQVEDLVTGRIHAAWNSPLAWVRARRLAGAAGSGRGGAGDARHRSRLVVGRRGSGRLARPQRSTTSPARWSAPGAVDSPQATLLPLDALRTAGVEPGVDVKIRRFDVGVGLHGDHIGGERDAARALMAGQVDAACMIDSNHLAFSRDGTLPAGATSIVYQTEPFDHCNMTFVDSAPAGPGGPLRGPAAVDGLRRSRSASAARPRGPDQWLPGRVSPLPGAGTRRRQRRLLRRPGKDQRC